MEQLNLLLMKKAKIQQIFKLLTKIKVIYEIKQMIINKLSN